MFPKSPKGTGEERKASGGPSKAPGGPSGGSSEADSPPTESEMDFAVSTLAWALEAIGVAKYGLIGGSAVSIYAAQCGLERRQTDDIDVLIQPTPLSADLAARNLTTDESVKGYFVSKRLDYVDKPHVVVPRGSSGTLHIPIEIFDWRAWPARQQYYDLDLESNAPQSVPVNNRQTPLLSPAWLLRQKLLAYAQRQNRNRTDMQDIHTLCTVFAVRGEAVAITDAAEIEALKQVLRASSPPDLQACVQCETIWPT